MRHGDIPDHRSDGAPMTRHLIHGGITCNSVGGFYDGIVSFLHLRSSASAMPKMRCKNLVIAHMHI